MAANQVTLYGFPVSQPTRSCKMLLHAGGVAFEDKFISIFTGEQKKPEYLAINPKGFVPAIKHGDFVLSEGAAILQYIAESFNLSSWYPTDVQTHARVNEWLHWVHTSIRQTSTVGIVRPVFMKQQFDEEAAMTAHTNAIQLLETQLAKTKFLVGDEPTIADLFVIPEIDQLVLFGKFDYSKSHPNIARWLNDFKQFEWYNNNIKEVVTVLQSAK